jgi:hypothetical protein
VSSLRTWMGFLHGAWGSPTTSERYSTSPAIALIETAIWEPDVR